MDKSIFRKSLVVRSDNSDDVLLDAVVEEAFRTTPLEPAPSQLFTNVMHAVQAMQARAVPAQRSTGETRTFGAVAIPQPYAGAMISNISTTRSPKPRFRATWVDLALSLFGAVMLALGWLFVGLLPQPWGEYLRLQALWSLQRLWYLNSDLLLWCCLALVVLAAGLAAGVLSCVRLGICTRATT